MEATGKQMNVDMSWLIDCSLQHVEKKDFSWQFVLGDGISIATEQSWRLVTADGIAVTSGDDGHQFGLPARICASDVVTAIIGEQALSEYGIDSSTGDLTLVFGSSILLQFLCLSSGYESWRATHGSQEVLCLGGGKLTQIDGARG